MKTTYTLLALLLFVSTFSCKKDKDSSAPAQPPVHLVLGQEYKGGIVAYLDASRKHGFVIWTSDLPVQNGLPWWDKWPNGYKLTGANASYLGGGKANTDAIMKAWANDVETEVAAGWCARMNTPEDSGWYMPNLGEMFKVYENLDSVGVDQFNTSKYWSSDEQNLTTAWYINMNSGAVGQAEKKEYMAVRPVRWF